MDLRVISTRDCKCMASMQMQCIYLISGFCAVCVIFINHWPVDRPDVLCGAGPCTCNLFHRSSVIISFRLLCIPWDRCLQLGDLAFRICTHLSDTWRLASGGCVVQYGGCFWHTLIRTSSIDP